MNILDKKRIIETALVKVRFTKKSLMKDFKLSESDANEVCLQADQRLGLSRWHNFDCPNCGFIALSVEEKDLPNVDGGWCDECGTAISRTTDQSYILYSKIK